jgi:hypothetical protein
MKPQVFAVHAHSLRDAGLAVIPLAAKDPQVSGFNRWRGRPSHKTIDGWCQKFPSSNVGYVPGLSDLVVVDDDGGAEAAIRETFGDTPGKVGTRRAAHHLYRKPRGPMPSVMALKKFGINADLKHGNTIAVAPPSIHETGAVYHWKDCGPEVLQDLPVFPVERLKALIARHQDMSQAGRKAAAGFRSGSRTLALNDHLCRHGTWCDTLGELIDVARTWNENQSSQFQIEKLDEKDVMQTAHGVWQDMENGKIERWHGRSAKVRSNLDEINALLSLGRYGAHAYALLMSLRANHGARCTRGESFSITPKAMASAGTLPGFTREYIEKGRDLLLEAGFIKIVGRGQISAKGRTPKLYQLSGRGAF